MFLKKTCSRCGRRVNKNHSYCPFCGNNLRAPKIDDIGFSAIRMPFPFGRIFDKLTKELARELDKSWDFDEEKRDVKKKGISISISNVDGVPRIKVGNVKSMPGMLDEKPARRIVRRVSKEDAERYSKLPRKEAQTSVKRLADGIVYEIALPGVENIKDIFINRLHNSIEVKAFGKDNAYFKLIPLDLNVKKYSLKDGKLVLELRE